MRVATHLFVAALMRRARAAGAFATVARKGEENAGAVFVCVLREGRATLYAPRPSAEDGSRLHGVELHEVAEGEVADRLRSEARFDPDHWVVDIEDRQGRPFLTDLVEDPDG